MLMTANAAPAMLGLHAQKTAPAVQQCFAEHIPYGSGLTVLQLTPGTAAAKQLRPGDVLLQEDDTPLRTPEDLSTIVQSKQSGDYLRLLRNGSPLELKLQLAKRPTQPVLSREQQREPAR